MRLRPEQDARQPVRALEPNRVFDRIFTALVAQAGVPKQPMIDSTHFKMAPS